MAQAPPSISLLYGPTGSPTLTSRFSIEGQPFAAIPLSHGGTVSNRPAHSLGLTGSAYRYGGTTVNGAKNILPIDSAAVSLPPYSHTFSAQSFDLGKVTGTNSPFHVPMQTYNARYPYLPSVTLIADGEVIGSAAPGATESFTTAGTVTITNGNSTVTGSGTSWTTNTLSTSYSYTAALNLIYPGDILKVTGHPVSGTVYYRIQSVTSNTALVVFPTPAETTASGLSYSILRSGYGSYSRVVTLGDNPTSYYAGMLYANAGVFAFPKYSGVRPTIMAYDTTLSPTHQMGPTGVYASDIAYYKSYLLYGYGSSIGWTVPGFPTTTPFASADFPASSLTVVSTKPEDLFVAFEFIGDQLVAIFTRSMWVVQQNPGQTQSSAFSFYRLPEVVGAVVPMGNAVTSTDPTLQCGVGGAFFRPTCSADGAIYYLGTPGLMEFSNVNSRAVCVSDDVNDILPHGASLHYDPVSDSVIVEQYGDPMYVYNRAKQTWSIATWYNCFGPFDNWSLRRSIPRMLRWTHYDGTSIVGQEVDQTTTNYDRPTTSPTDAWSWASPIVNLSDVYTDFKVYGLRIDCEAPGLTTANVTYTLYGGSTPYSMTSQATGTYNAALGTTSGRNLINIKLDFPFVAVTLSGSTRIKLNEPCAWIYGYVIPTK